MPVLNTFLVGADPEFGLFDEGKYVYAASVNTRSSFLPDRVYGPDGSGRQMELRPAPARSCVRVVAGLAWAMGRLLAEQPDAARLSWQSRPWIPRTDARRLDGCGGHVHFGRKRHMWFHNEVATLSVVEDLLNRAGWFDSEAVAVRRSTGYGQIGDTRPQAYGYEFRQFPTWLCSPAQAFMSLTAAKVAVLAARDTGTSVLTRMTLKELLQKFADRDSDARLALKLKAPAAWEYTRDFKAAWGLTSEWGTEMRPSKEPPEDWVRETRAALREGRAPRFIPTGDWRMRTLQTQSPRWRDVRFWLPVPVAYVNKEHVFQVSPTLLGYMPQAWRDFVAGAAKRATCDYPPHIVAPVDMLDGLLTRQPAAAGWVFGDPKLRVKWKEPLCAELQEL